MANLVKIKPLVLLTGLGLLLMLIYFRGFLTTSPNAAIWGISYSADPVGDITEGAERAAAEARGCAWHITNHSFPFGYLQPSYSFYDLAVPFVVPHFLVRMTNAPVFSFNASIWVIFLLNFFLSYLAFRLLLQDAIVAILPAVALTFSAYTIAHSWAHLGLLDIFFFPCFIYAFIKLQQTGKVGFAVLSAFIGSFSVYTSPYYFYFIAWTAFAILASFVLRQPKRYAQVRLLGANLACAALTLVGVLPFARDQYLRDFSPYWQKPIGAADYGNDMRFLYMSSARPADYFLPNIKNIAFGDFFAKFISEPGPGRDIWSDEFPIAIGILPTIFVVAMFCVWILRRKPLRSLGKTPLRTWLAPINRAYEQNPDIFLAFVAVAIVSFVISLPPSLTIGDTKWPMPNEIFRHFVPFRSYSRFAFVTLTAVIGLMAMTLRHVQNKLAWVLAIAAFGAFECLPATHLYPASAEAPYIQYLRQRPERVIMRFEKQNVQHQRVIDLETMLADKLAFNGVVNYDYGYTELPLQSNAGRFNAGHLALMGAEILIVDGHMNPPERDQPYLEKLAFFPDTNTEIWKLKPADDPIVEKLFKPFLQARSGQPCYVAPKASVQQAMAQYYSYLRSQ